ncbi:MAG: hypothetical protein MR809_01670, partial [Rikenellaceae bacterium]|nr:hypothetical protein [Rikenellaceae bacterium]
CSSTMRKNLRIEPPKNRRKMVGGSGEISPLPPTIFVMITNQKWQLYPSYPQSLRDSPGGAYFAGLIKIPANECRTEKIH